MHFRKYLICFLLLPLGLDAQVSELTGLWKGMLFNDTTRRYYRYEIAITNEKGKLTGYSHTWFLLGGKRFYGLKKVKVKQTADGKVIIEDNGLLQNNYPIPPAKNVRQLNVLTLSTDGEIKTLDGPFATNQTKEYSVLTGSVNLIKTEDYKQSDLVAQLEELGLEKKIMPLLAKTPGSIIAPTVNTQYALTMIPETENKGLVNEDPVSQQRVDEKSKADKALATVQTNSATIANKPETKNEVVENTNEQRQTGIISQKPAKEVEPSTTTRKEVVKNNDPTPVIKKEQPLNPASQDPKPANPATSNTVLVTSNPVGIDLALHQTEINALNIVRASNAALKVNERNTELQQIVPFSSDSLELSLFDNGEVDGDTVSVLMNENLIIAKQRLSTNAYRKIIYINPGEDSIRLIMYAENLGSIAPNTGLLVIRDGKDIYEVRFRGDLQKNAAIVLRRKR